ncbi:hypothetical protein E2C01_069597 [Portunus trituberculatus]|uniref:Uncharacterized protein n=1 Tax=Portunus trituberculatus TaxID=210409 RepID=A0A5B7I382_PORTR|nr:hypothetical protein [Portunus trituberculatus]
MTCGNAGSEASSGGRATSCVRRPWLLQQAGQADDCFTTPSTPSHLLLGKNVQKARVHENNRGDIKRLATSGEWTRQRRRRRRWWRGPRLRWHGEAGSECELDSGRREWPQRLALHDRYLPWQYQSSAGVRRAAARHGPGRVCDAILS